MMMRVRSGCAVPRKMLRARQQLMVLNTLKKRHTVPNNRLHICPKRADTDHNILRLKEHIRDGCKNPPYADRLRFASNTFCHAKRQRFIIRNTEGIRVGKGRSSLQPHWQAPFKVGSKQQRTWRLLLQFGNDSGDLCRSTTHNAKPTDPLLHQLFDGFPILPFFSEAICRQTREHTLCNDLRSGKILHGSRSSLSSNCFNKPDTFPLKFSNQFPQCVRYSLWLPGRSVQVDQHQICHYQ